MAILNRREFIQASVASYFLEPSNWKAHPLPRLRSLA